MKSIPSNREVASLASWPCCKHRHNTCFVSHSVCLAGARLRLVFLFSGELICTQGFLKMYFKREPHFGPFPMTRYVFEQNVFLGKKNTTLFHLLWCFFDVFKVNLCSHFFYSHKYCLYLVKISVLCLSRTKKWQWSLVLTCICIILC